MIERVSDSINDVGSFGVLREGGKGEGKREKGESLQGRRRFKGASKSGILRLFPQRIRSLPARFASRKFVFARDSATPGGLRRALSDRNV